jgi:surfeit locus 1 family protein
MNAVRARIWVLVATVLGVAATTRLAVWQLDRAAQKIAMQSALDARSGLAPLDAAGLARTADEATTQHYRPVHLHGRWLAERSVFLENRQMNGHVGFYVLTPLALAGSGDAVLVQRGWAPRDQLDRTHVPVVPTPAGEIDIEGRIAPPPARLYEFQGSAGGTIRQNLDLGEFARETGLQLRPVSVQQADSSATAGDGLLRQWPLPAVDVHKHYGYAFQWGALGALMTGLYVWFQLIRPRLRRSAG